MSNRPWLWIFSIAGALAGAYVTYGAAAYWSIFACGGVAEASAQRLVCNTIGDFGGVAQFVVVYLAAVVATIWLLRSGWVSTGYDLTFALATALVGPSLAVVAFFVLMNLPPNSCTSEQRRQFRADVQDWRATGEHGERPTACVEYSGS